MMPTFIDESGDTGTYQASAHRFFRLAAVWVPSSEVAEAIRDEIRAVRRSLGLRADYEFKFSKTWQHPDRRQAFFDAVLKHEFRFAFAVVDKSHEHWREASTQDIHWAAATELAATLRSTYLTAFAVRSDRKATGPLNELVIVDDNEDKQFLATIKLQFRRLGQLCTPPMYLVGKSSFEALNLTR
jgi:hypothetical protein